MKLTTILASAGLAAALAAAAPAMAATNLLVNGNFEADQFGGNYGYYNVGTQTGANGGDHAIPADFGWIVSNGNVDLVYNGDYGPHNPNGGSNVLDLVGYGSTGEISQSINTVAGRVYNVSLDYTGNSGVAGFKADLLAGGASVGALTSTGAWSPYATSFVGTGAPMTFAINETLGGGNAGVFLDNVSITAVPEPGAWALMLAGLAVMGAALRARKRTAVVAA